ncbi:MAG: acyl CoA binding protein-domain-containing protein [Monoraphidium minutum]|nr:MAG: acyl CoA binding protein-domain-containing protein [Monoraphidium minutum]
METDEDLGMLPGEQAFSAAADRVAAAVVAGPRPSEADLLRLYGLYKHATAGDCGEPSPAFWRLAERKKWSAWSHHRGTPQQDAMAQYTALADRCLGAAPDDSGGGGGGSGGTRAAKGGGLGGPVMSRMVHSAGDERGPGPGPGAAAAAAAAGGGGGAGEAAEAERVRALAAEGDEAALAAALDRAGPGAAAALLRAADPDSGCAALHFAADRGRRGAVALLVGRGAELDARDAEGQTALHYAAVCGHREVYDALLAAGADPSIRDNDGPTPPGLEAHRCEFQLDKLIVSVFRAQKRCNPAAMRGGTAGEADAVARHERRRTQNNAANRRYQQKQKQIFAAMRAELDAMRERLVLLLHTNVTLHARERALQRAVEGGDLALWAAGGGSEAAPPSSSWAPVHVQQQLVLPAAAAGRQGAPQSKGIRGPATPPAPHPAGSPAAAATAHAPPGGRGLGWAVPAPSGDALLARALQRSRELVASARGTPDDVLAAIRQRFREFVAAYEAAKADPTAAARSTELFKTLHGHVRQMFAADPSLRAQLRGVNLQTLAREAPPPAHWDAVILRGRLLEEFTQLPLHAQLEVREMVALHRGSMERLRLEQEGLLAQLLAASQELQGAEDAVLLSPSYLDALPERHARCDDLLRALDAARRSELTLAHMLQWGGYRLTPLAAMERCYAESWPWWPDVWALYSKLVDAACGLDAAAMGAAAAAAEAALAR